MYAEKTPNTEVVMFRSHIDLWKSQQGQMALVLGYRSWRG
jgi:hypothetical protein